MGLGAHVRLSKSFKHVWCCAQRQGSFHSRPGGSSKRKASVSGGGAAAGCCAVLCSGGVAEQRRGAGSASGGQVLCIFSEVPYITAVPRSWPGETGSGRVVPLMTHRMAGAIGSVVPGGCGRFPCKAAPHFCGLIPFADSFGSFFVALDGVGCCLHLGGR